jgi:hypothetical protein
MLFTPLWHPGCVPGKEEKQVKKEVERGSEVLRE